MVLGYIGITVILVIIYQICCYQLYKELKKNAINTSLSIYGPGPDVLYKYFIYKKNKNKSLSAKFFIGSIAFVLALLLIVFAIF